MREETQDQIRNCSLRRNGDGGDAAPPATEARETADGAAACGVAAANAVTARVGSVGAGAVTSKSRCAWFSALVILQWLQHGIVPCIAAIIERVRQHAAALAGITAVKTTRSATARVAKRRVMVEI